MMLAPQWVDLVERYVNIGVRVNGIRETWIAGLSAAEGTEAA